MIDLITHNSNQISVLPKPQLSSLVPRTGKILCVTFTLFLLFKIIKNKKSKPPVMLGPLSKLPQKNELTMRIQQESRKQWERICSQDFRRETLWKEKAVKLLRQSYYESPEEELARLEGTILAPEMHKNVGFDPLQINNADLKLYISEAFHRLQIPHSELELKTSWTQVMLSRVFEIKAIYGNTHHIFISAQATQWFAISILVKEILRKKNPDKCFSFMKFLRDSSDLETPKGIGDWLSEKISFLSRFFSILDQRKKQENSPETLEKFLARQWIMFDEITEQRKKLLSVSGYFLDTTWTESAMYFLMNNKNILNNKNVISNVIRQILGNAFPGVEKQILDKHANTIDSSIPKNYYPCGNLFVICIPKERTKDIAYRSHPFGMICKCHPKKNDDAILEKIQNLKLDATVRCVFGIPQWRIFLPQLENPEEEIEGNTKEKIRIFRLSPIPKEERDQFKAVVRNVLNALFAQLEQIKNNCWEAPKEPIGGKLIGSFGTSKQTTFQ